MKTKFSTPRSRRGFTALELLVTITIIAILGSVLVLGYNMVIKRANQAKSQTNMRQIVAGLNTYANDYNNLIPLGERTSAEDTILISSGGTPFGLGLVLADMDSPEDPEPGNNRYLGTGEILFNPVHKGREELMYETYRNGEDHILINPAESEIRTGYQYLSGYGPAFVSPTMSRPALIEYLPVLTDIVSIHELSEKMDYRWKAAFMDGSIRGGINGSETEDQAAQIAGEGDFLGDWGKTLEIVKEMWVPEELYENFDQINP
ncbi:MAG: type II secretion system protein [Verrucomicrobiales bacterium]